MEIIVINITLLVSRLRKVKPKEISSSLICLKKKQNKTEMLLFLPQIGKCIIQLCHHKQARKERIQHYCHCKCINCHLLEQREKGKHTHFSNFAKTSATMVLLSIALSVVPLYSNKANIFLLSSMAKPRINFSTT